MFCKIQAEEYDDTQALLNAGADINVGGFAAQTPAIAAATADDWKSVLYLTDRVADLSLYGENGFTVANMHEGSRIRLDSEQHQVIKILNTKGYEGGMQFAGNLMKRGLLSQDELDEVLRLWQKCGTGGQV